MRTHHGHEMPTCGKAEHANFVRINLPFPRVKAHQPYRPLRILERQRRSRIDVTPALLVPGRPGIRYAVLQQHARDPFGGQPVTDLRAFEIDGQNLIAAAGEYDHRSAGVLPLWRIDGQRGPRDVAHVNPWLSGD